jgi:hypothetical protein
MAELQTAVVTHLLIVAPKQPDLRHILSLPAVLHVCLKRLQSLATPQNYNFEFTAASVTVH